VFVDKDVMLILNRTIKLLLNISLERITYSFNRTKDFLGIKMNRTLKNANEEGRGMRLVSDGAAEAKAEKNVQYLPSPIKSQNDKKNYK
jgi:hypothetical protein